MVSRVKVSCLVRAFKTGVGPGHIEQVSRMVRFQKYELEVLGLMRFVVGT